MESDVKLLAQLAYLYLPSLTLDQSHSPATFEFDIDATSQLPRTSPALVFALNGVSDTAEFINSLTPAQKLTVNFWSQSQELTRPQLIDLIINFAATVDVTSRTISVSWDLTESLASPQVLSSQYAFYLYSAQVPAPGLSRDNSDWVNFGVLPTTMPNGAFAHPRPP